VPRELHNSNIKVPLTFDYKEYVFWEVTPCSLVYNVSGEPSCTLTMEAAGSPKILIISTRVLDGT
jgi:hypothetical protein